MDDHVLAVLRAYPAIYMACHVEHRTRGRSADGLTSRDAGLLAHIDAGGTSPAALAKHLGIGAPALSATLARLAAGGFLAIAADLADRRRRSVKLTDAGRAAIAAASVLDSDRLAAMLRTLTEAERRRAVAGIELLAAAARRLREQGE